MHSSIELVKESLPGGNFGGVWKGRFFVQNLLRRYSAESFEYEWKESFSECF